MRARSLRRLCPVACLAAGLLAGCSLLSSAETARLDVFDTYVEALAERYPYFAQKHVDWPGLARAYRAAVVAAERPSQFYHLLTALLAELDDPHVSLQVLAKCWVDADGPPASLLDLPGLQVATIDRRLHVFAWPDAAAPTPPAHLPPALADLPEVVRIGGARVTAPLLRNLVLGPPGSAVELQLRWADGTCTHHTLRRPARAKPRTVRVWRDDELLEVEILPPGKTLAQAADLRPLGRFAVLRLSTLAPDQVEGDEDRFVAHLDSLLQQAAALDGLILDLRGNHGGRFSMVARLLGRFLAQKVELVTDIQRSSWLFGLFEFETFLRLSLEPRAPRWDKPVVVLTSWDTASAAEHLARQLQRAVGALVVGEQTIGAEAGLERVQGGDGTTLVFGRERYVDVTGVGIQDEGVTPDVSVRLRLDDVRRCGSLAAARADWEQRLLAAAEQQLQRLVEAAAAKPAAAGPAAGAGGQRER